MCIWKSDFVVSRFLGNTYVNTWWETDNTCSAWYTMSGAASTCRYSTWIYGESTKTAGYGRVACESGEEVTYSCGTDATCTSCKRFVYGKVHQCDYMPGPLSCNCYWHTECVA
eukprot:TRINITY_DN1958_c0_g1_i2.p2 TRINITY_DN1958_c0_g1~~TRINITY_DN1958_c0_g1_i2.p2  ORF type:complete len:113 (-),score=27.39 TRINITY_DN1958_c0_g1_i2:92-430(-)